LRYDTGLLGDPLNFQRLELRFRNGPQEVVLVAYLDLVANMHFSQIFGIVAPAIDLQFGMLGALGFPAQGVGAANPNNPIAPPPGANVAPFGLGPFGPLPPPIEIVPFCIALLDDAIQGIPMPIEYAQGPLNMINQEVFEDQSIVYMVNDNPNSIYTEDDLRNWFQGAPGMGPRCRDPLTNAVVFNVTKVEIQIQ
jgi:hypothetical protein